jgi:hypothetical protein
MYDKPGFLFPLCEELIRKGYQTCQNRVLIDETRPYSAFDLVKSTFFTTIIRQRYVDGKYVGLGFVKLTMNDNSFSIMDNTVEQGKLRIVNTTINGQPCQKLGLFGCDSKAEQTERQFREMRFVMVNGKLTLQNALNDKIRQGHNIQKSNPG